jgi:Protein of unknown function (DUF2510)
MTTPLPAGWYPDQVYRGYERWFDGEAWSEATRPAQPYGPVDADTRHDGSVEIGPTGPDSRRETPGSVAIAEPDPPRRRRSIWIGAGLVALIAVALGVVAALTLTNTPKTSVKGAFLLIDTETANADCVGQGGYSDISEGASVILTNQDNKILGSASLDAGTANKDSGSCIYLFTIPNVPKDQSQYAVEVSHRGKIVNSKADMVKEDWSITASMGS